MAIAKERLKRLPKQHLSNHYGNIAVVVFFNLLIVWAAYM